MNQETYTQTAPNSTQIRTQNNNYYSYNTFNKSLKNFKEQIPVIKIYFINKENLINHTALLISFLLLIAYFYTFLGSILTIFITIISSFIYYLLYKKAKNNNSGYLEIKDKSIIVNFDKKCENIELKFTEIRSFLLEKTMYGYQFFIYLEDAIKPKTQFKTTDIHTALAIEELLKYKIMESIEK
ncbi:MULTISPECIES: hypothetical protein [Aliarcobacter]|uniref:Membrane protein n=1 Tax=Aliarcobacter skirrowii CCUG 10374 TaxID=1032239 RepID=A0AAD0WN92_9BACT|nr:MULTISPECIES: hypothetical protein [Aliarcobacter]AXX84657.1 putative membrane protein [Aliarcobacter skirrowii CCUG 10374]KAB0620202.1 hypothetical protein F7P70_08100 [Aliarcobacter skirrowii CCUG 10374]OCL85519.1 hypothetical protein AAX26_01947 [Aliarcobacter thereius]RXI25385.1 hypothetical protein CP959_08130 [Aliarcobacter skirrowii CCUG 10374]SUV14828.1 Uncharacterised protein [Aliarcobacter skirrowii]